MPSSKVKHRTHKDWSADELALMEQMYLRDKKAYADIAKAIGGVTKTQVSRKITAMGWPKLRRLSTDSLSETDKQAIVEVNEQQARVASGDRYIEEVVGKSQAVAEKAFRFAEESGNPRDLNSAIQAASKAVSMYRQAKGLDGDGALKGATFNMFYNQAPLSPQAIDV